jgi:hypothetical protein
VRVKRELNTRGVDRIKGLTSRELAEKCPDGRAVFPVSPCSNCCCDYAIKEPGYMNCSFVASEVSEHTLEAIGEMMEISREGVRKIEVRALQKVRLAMELLAQHHDDPSICEPSLAAGADYLDPYGEVFESEDPPDDLPALNGRRLVQCGR